MLCLGRALPAAFIPISAAKPSHITNVRSLFTSTLTPAREIFCNLRTTPHPKSIPSSPQRLYSIRGNVTPIFYQHQHQHQHFLQQSQYRHPFQYPYQQIYDVTAALSKATNTIAPTIALSVARLTLSCVAMYSVAKNVYCEQVVQQRLKNNHLSREQFVKNAGKNCSPVDDWFSLLMKAMRPDWPLFLGAVVIALSTSLLEIMIPSSVGQLIQTVSNGTPIGSLGYELCGIFAAQSILHFLYYSVLSVAAERMSTRLKMMLYESIIHQEIGFFDATSSGELVSRLSGDVAEVRGAVKHTITLGIRSVMQIVGGSVSLFFISKPLTMLLTVSLPSMVVFGTIFTWALQDLSKRVQKATAESTGVASEVISNIRTVRAFAAEDRELDRYASFVDKSHELACQFGVGIGVFQGLNMIAVNAVVLLVGWYGGNLISQGHLTQGGMTSFMLHSQSLQHAFKSLSILHGQILKAAGATQRIFEVIYREPEIPTKNDGVHLEHGHGSIQFDRVLFRYPTRKNTTVLNGLDLSVEPGQVVALVGPSGSGKTTIVSLLERFYEPFAGQIRIDGIDIQKIDPHSLRQTIGIVTQEPILFSTSIEENIRYGRPDATKEEIMEAARKANAHEFIMHFPDAYDTVVGERGTLLSGGQKQRIAIARAILKDPRILILDEATSALDSQNEALVQQALDRLMEGRTVIIVAHRLSTIRNADRIVVMQNGGVVESGSHEDLMSIKNGVYANLVRQQTEKNTGR